MKRGKRAGGGVMDLPREAAAGAIMVVVVRLISAIIFEAVDLRWMQRGRACKAAAGVTLQ
jgi:hypothetical protein